MDKKILAVLVCPLCKGSLYYDKQAQELICRGDRLAYPIRRDGFPNMLVEDARELAPEESVPKP